MKRALTVTFTTMIAIGLIFMMGFAGAAAAEEHPDDGISADFSGGDGGDGGDAAVSQSLDQENNNAQVGIAAAESTDDGKYSKYSGGASAGVTQEQNVGQSNVVGEQSATAIAGDGGDGGDGGSVAVDLNITDEGQFVPPGLANN